MYAWFNMLGAMPMLRGGRSCSINWENRTGEKGAGCKAASDLGPGRKGSPCIPGIAPGETITLAEISGCGIIQHIWCTVTDATPAGRFVLRGHMLEKTYCTPFMGYPFYSRDDNFHNDYFNRDVPPMRGFYRWHIMDPILFKEDLRVTLQQIGVCELGLFERQDDVCSVSYWYQREPHGAFPPLPDARARWPR